MGHEMRHLVIICYLLFKAKLVSIKRSLVVWLGA